MCWQRNIDFLRVVRYLAERYEMYVIMYSYFSSYRPSPILDYYRQELLSSRITSKSLKLLKNVLLKELVSILLKQYLFLINFVHTIGFPDAEEHIKLPKFLVKKYAKLSACFQEIYFSCFIFSLLTLHF